MRCELGRAIEELYRFEANTKLPAINARINAYSVTSYRLIGDTARDRIPCAAE